MANERATPEALTDEREPLTEAKPMKWRCLCCGAFIKPDKDGFVSCVKCGWSAET